MFQTIITKNRNDCHYKQQLFGRDEEGFMHRGEKMKYKLLAYYYKGAYTYDGS